jgi:multicomponent Na+:H+ antiporter subunit D
MSGVGILALLLALPVAGAALVMICARPPGLRDVIHIGFALAVAALGAVLVSALRQHEVIRLALAHPLPGVELAFAVEPLGALFTVIVAGLSVLHAVHTVGFVRATAVQAPARMMAFIALTAGATIAVALSANLFTLFVAYQALILAGAPLIQDRDPEEEGRAARVYLTTQLGTSIGLFLPAVVWTYSLASSSLASAPEFRAGGMLEGLVDPISASALLVLFVLGASMSIVPPLSSWINASSGSRWPALTSIHSLALAPAGVITIVKVAAYVFGPALGEASLAAHALLVLCGGGAGLAALIAISRQDLNERIAYVCAAQNLSALVGALLALPAGLFAATLQVAATCCAGSTVIMAAGAVAAVTGRLKAADYVGLGRVMPWTLGGFAVGSASMIGMPPFAGAWAKLWLITAAAGAGLMWAAGLVGIAAVLTFAALGPLAANALAGKAPTDAFRRPDGASIFLAAPIVVGAAATLSLLALADSLATFLSPVWTPPT